LAIDKFQEFREVQHCAMDMASVDAERNLSLSIEALGDGMLWGGFSKTGHSTIMPREGFLIQEPGLHAAQRRDGFRWQPAPFSNSSSSANPRREKSLIGLLPQSSLFA
jgi:hypothetical protein